MKKEQNTGTGKTKLTVVFLCIFSLIAISQEPANKKKAKNEPVKIIVDTTVVVERKADTLYLKQSLVMDGLDSLIQEKQNK